MHIDLLAFPGHKSLLGPTGTGALYVGAAGEDQGLARGRHRRRLVQRDAAARVPVLPRRRHAERPRRRRLAAGHPVGRGAGLEKIHAHEVGLTERLWRRLDEIAGFEVFGHRDLSRRVGTLSFRSEALPAAELGGILDQAFDIAIRPGLHCAPYIHRRSGTFPDGTVRVSPGPFNTEADIDQPCLSATPRNPCPDRRLNAGNAARR